MSLLDWGNEDVLVFPTVISTDPDGDTIAQPSPTGQPVRARVQPMDMTESQVRGYVTEQLYRLIIARWDIPQPDAFAAVEWRGDRYEIVGEPEVYSGSPRTARKVWTMRRS